MFVLKRAARIRTDRLSTFSLEFAETRDRGIGRLFAEAECLLLDQSGQSRILAWNDLSANDP